ncbi:MAG: ATP-binding cassette domain-containing protein [Deltaproteobacteria bacterium]|nr:ATP-binding cassette domain-containing protein [Deltaproteobacteria bacterium]
MSPIPQPPPDQPAAAPPGGPADQPDQPDQPVLAVDQVQKTFTTGGRVVTALDGVSLTAWPGRVTGLIGPDGAGKTTLMRLVAGLLPADEGALSVLGRDVGHEPQAVQSTLGYMPQRFGLYEDLKVQENLDLYADLQGLAPAERPPRYEELLHMTGLGPFTGRLAGDLSGGMKQKLGLACTLVAEKQLLLLDEPTVGVDPLSRRELWAIVYRLVREKGLAVLLSTAYLDEAERCQEVILLHRGRVLGQGAPGDFSREAQGRSFLVSAPGIPRRALQRRLAAAPGILDALIHSQGARVVLAREARPDPAAWLPGATGVAVTESPPRFEDSFVIRLKEEKAGAAEPGTPAAPAAPVAPVAMDPPEPATAPAGGTPEEVIVVADVVRRFGSFTAVKGISFRVYQGEVFGLLGANGAGKSTTFRMLCGLLPASGGSLSVAGRDLRTAAAQARARIGYMAQRFSLYANLSVRENLDFFSRAYGLKGARQKERLAWALAEFGLAEVAGAMSGNLPLGYKQRLALAAALMHEPRILFLDEPTSGVDPLARRDFWRRINHLAESGVTVLITTHFLEEAEYCDRLVIMDQGEILDRGTPAEVKERTGQANMEDAFISLIESRAQARAQGAAA